MNEEERKDLALFRYQLIAPLLRMTERGAIQAALNSIAKEEHTLPNGSTRRFSVRTLERYLSGYRKGGLDALMPEVRNDRSRPRALPPAIIERAIALRREQPARTVEQLITILESEQLALPDTLKRSTLASHLHKAGAQRHARTAKTTRAHQRYGSDEVHEIWQCDVCDSLRIPDPETGQMRIARLTAILDDRSRYICQAVFAFRENLPVLEDVLKKAIIRHGTPKIFYCDYAEKNTMPRNPFTPRK
jgi:putative transposase